MDVNYTSDRFISYRDLMRTIQKLIYSSWGKKNVRFTSAYPSKVETENISTPIITYKIKRKVPGRFGNREVAEIKPRSREIITVKDENNNDVPIEFMGQMFDYRILFEIWSTDGDSADEIAERFQSFMTEYTGYLKKNGAQEIIFEELFEDSGTQWKTDLIRRSLIYHIRLDEVVGARNATFKEFEVGTNSYTNVFDMLLNIHALSEDPLQAKDYEVKSILLSDDDN